MNTNKIEAAAATAATAAGPFLDSWIQAGNHLIQFIVTLMTLAWWVDLWWRKRKAKRDVKPPKDYLG